MSAFLNRVNNLVTLIDIVSATIISTGTKVVRSVVLIEINKQAHYYNSQMNLSWANCKVWILLGTELLQGVIAFPC